MEITMQPSGDIVAGAAASGSVDGRKRNADQTRTKLLDAAFAEIYRNGFRAASLDTILEAAGVTKGAMYHHFESKTALGYAVVDEVIRPRIESDWAVPLSTTDDPVEEILAICRCLASRLQPASYGCPVNNLAQEMSPIDEGFRLRIKEVFDYWISAIADALERGRATGSIRADVNPRAAATFFIASLEGSIGLVKNARSAELLGECFAGIEAYLRSLSVRAFATA